MKIVSLKNVTNTYIFLLLYAALLTFALIPYYRNGTLILGGEGNFVLDFACHFNKSAYTWIHATGVGMPAVIPNGTGVNILLLRLIEKLTSTLITNFILIFCIYYTPFIAIYLVCKKLKSTPVICIVCSFFYVLNPFASSYLLSLNQWSVFSLAVIPLFLWVILKYYEDNFKLFFFFGLISACVSFTFANPPTLVVIISSTLLSVGIASYYYDQRFSILEIFKKFSILLFSFIIFNSWWILSLIAAIDDARAIYTPSYARSALNTHVGYLSNYGSITAKIFSFTTAIPQDTTYNFFGFLFGTAFAQIIGYIPICTVMFLYFHISRGEKKHLFYSVLLLAFLAISFLIKGNASPFGFIYNFMFQHIPFFYVFKSPVEKFGILHIFVFTIFLLYVLKKIQNEIFYNVVVGLLSVYLVFCCIPIMTGNIIPDNKIGENEYASRRYIDKPEYRQFKAEVNHDLLEYRIIGFPGGWNYQVCLKNYNNKYYTGLDPLFMNINKPFVSPYNRIDFLYNNISDIGYKKLLGLYAIKKIVINEDVLPWFGTIEKEDIREVKAVFSRFMSFKKSGTIIIYDNKDYFLPPIYISTLPFM